MLAYCRDDVLGFNLNLNLRAAIVKNEKSWSLMCVFLRLFLCSFVSGNFSQKKFFMQKILLSLYFEGGVFCARFYAKYPANCHRTNHLKRN